MDKHQLMSRKMRAVPSPIASESGSVDLDGDFDQMMKAPANSLSPLPRLHNSDTQEEDNMVDYNDETAEERDVLAGLDNSLGGGLSANAGRPPGNPESSQVAISAKEITKPAKNVAEITQPVMTQPVLTQKGLMEITTQQSSNVMQVQG